MKAAHSNGHNNDTNVVNLAQQRVNDVLAVCILLIMRKEEREKGKKIEKDKKKGVDGIASPSLTSNGAA